MNGKVAGRSVGLGHGECSVWAVDGVVFFFSSRRRHTRCSRDWSSDVCSSDLLTVGPNGNVKADLNAREIIVRGKVEGKVIARDKLQIGSTGQITGEVQTNRLVIEDGATLRGKVEAGKLEVNRPAETKTVAAAAAANTNSTKPSPQPTALGSETAAD